MSNPLEKWQAEGACFETDDLDIFFSSKVEQKKQAKRLCGMCKVRLTCLRYAISNNIEDGIWGGLEPLERGKIRGFLTLMPAQPQAT